MVMVSRIGDLESSSLSMTMCDNRMESVMIGVTPLSIPIITTVRGSRVVEGESHEHNWSGFSWVTVVSSPTRLSSVLIGSDVPACKH